MLARNTVLLMLLLLAGTRAGYPEPRDGFFDIDEPVYLGAEILNSRLDLLRRDGPLTALHLSGGSARAWSFIMKAFTCSAEKP